MSRTIRTWGVLSFGALLSVGCVPDADPICSAGEAHCVVKLDGTCNPGLHKQLVRDDEFALSNVLLQSQPESDQVWICCRDDEPAAYCELPVRDQASGTSVIEGDRELVIDGDQLAYSTTVTYRQAFVLELAAGARALVDNQFEGRFATVEQGLPALPAGRPSKAAFELAFAQGGPPVLLTLPSPRTPDKPSAKTLVFAMQLNGACRAVADWENGPLRTRCDTSSTSRSYLAPLDEGCRSFLADTRSSSQNVLCSAEGRVQLGPRLLLCVTAPCTWQQVGEEMYQTTPDGSAHLRTTLSGLYMAVAE
jgi:hypothetical protein